MAAAGNRRCNDRGAPSFARAERVHSHRARKPVTKPLGEQQLVELRTALESMALVSGLNRACGSIRQHLERTLLGEAGLHWSGIRHATVPVD